MTIYYYDYYYYVTPRDCSICPHKHTAPLPLSIYIYIKRTIDNGQLFTRYISVITMAGSVLTANWCKHIASNWSARLTTDRYIVRPLY